MLTCLLRRSCSFSLRAQAPKPRQALHHRCLRCLHSKPAFADEKTVPHFESRRLERTIYDWWEESGLFKPIASSSSSQKPFVVPMPPPNVTGYLHMGHAIFLALQDIIVRYHRMTGRPTLWIPGTDHAGIATQLMVEKQLQKQGLSKHLLGRDRFVEKAWEWKEDKGSYILQQMRRLGASADWSREKFTLDPSMNEAVTEAFVRLYDRGLIYRGEYMVNWSPALQTAVSDLEVEHSDEAGSMFYFKYQLADGSGFIPVATTRPETILGDAAVCVHPADLRFRHLLGKMVIVPMVNRIIPIIADEYVEMEFGSGALKVTPAHDMNDHVLGKKHKLDTINVLNKDGTINENGGRYAGMDRFECRRQIWADMGRAGLVIKEEAHQQRVPRSQRGGEIIEPMVSSQWFVKMDDMAQRSMEAVNNGQLTIVPQRYEKVWGAWLSNIHDWCISRQLWWGHRIPVYYVVGSDQREFVVARTPEVARQLAERKYGPGVRIEQDEDVLDTWFSSGLWPFATLGWPQKENDLDSDYHKYYPAAVLETGHDILFFWVARMVALGLELTDRLPFSTIYLHGLVRDAQGQKMSKTKGNVIDPLETIENYGCDALRFALVTGCTPGQDIPLALEKVEANRKFANKLWNVGKFVQLATEGAVVEGGVELGPSLSLPERYIVSRCHELVNCVTLCLNGLDIAGAGKALYDFLWDELADWFVEASKPRLRGSMEDRQRARDVLVYVWDVYLRLLHPFMPFITEVLWQHIQPNEQGSIMIAQWPQSHLPVDLSAITTFQMMQNLVRMVRNARLEHGVEVAQRIELIVRASEPTLSALIAEGTMLAMLTRSTDCIRFVAHGTMIPEEVEAGQAVHLVVDSDVEAFLPRAGLLDKQKELIRLGKQIVAIKKDLQLLESRLNNTSFRAKAPVALIVESETKATGLRSQLAALELHQSSLM